MRFNSAFKGLMLFRHSLPLIMALGFIMELVVMIHL